MDENQDGQIVFTSGNTHNIRGRLSAVFDPSGMTNCSVQNLPTSSMFGAGVFSRDPNSSKLYPMVCGGCVNDCSKTNFKDVDEEKLRQGQISRDCKILEKDGSWTAGPQMTKGRIRFSLTRVANMVVAVGGRTAEELKGTTAVEKFDSGKWSECKPIPTPIYDHCSLADDKNNRILVLGGIQKDQVRSISNGFLKSLLYGKADIFTY